VGYHHQLAMISVVGTGLVLPFDVEPYGPGDSKFSASRRRLRRAVQNLGPCFGEYVVADGDYARAPFLHDAGDLGLHAVVRLKDNNLPELFRPAEPRFRSQLPHLSFRDGSDRVEVWEADDFDPWNALRWETVRPICYRQRHPGGEVVEAYWPTNLPLRRVSRRSLYALAKSHWQIENRAFNDAKNRYGYEHICPHQSHSLLVLWLLTCLALMVERLYRRRYLHRGTHPALTAIDLLRILLLTLSARPRSPIPVEGSPATAPRLVYLNRPSSCANAAPVSPPAEIHAWKLDPDRQPHSRPHPSGFLSGSPSASSNQSFRNG
jgi:hypothetical protein